MSSYKDSGWAWVILFAATFEMALTVGIIKSSGVLFVAFQDRFHSDSATTSLLSTVHNAVYSICALFVMTVLVRLTSSRVMLFVGSIGSCLAFIITAVATDIQWLLLSYGVIQGIAFACAMPTSLTVVSHYFEKRRGFANCITVTGSSIGSFIYAPLITKLLSVYGYRGCMLVLAAIMLHGCICGALFRPLSFYETADKVVTEANQSEEKLLEEFDRRKRLFEIQRKKVLERTNRLKGGEPPVERQRYKLQIPAFKKVNSWEIRIRSYSENCANVVKPEEIRVESDIQLSRRVRKRSFSQTLLDESEETSPIKTRLKNVMESKFSGSRYVLGSIPDVVNDCMLKEGLEVTDVQPFYISDRSIDQKDTGSDNVVSKRSLFVQTLANICDSEVLKMPVFIAFQFACALLSAGTMLCAIFIVPHAKEMGISEDDIAMLIAIFSAVDVVGRIFTGLISDKKWLRRSTMVAMASVVVSLTAHLLRFYTTYMALVVYSAVLGAVNGVFFSLAAVIIVDYLSLARLQSVLGFTHLVQGFAVAGTFYLIGFLRDSTGSYLIAFHLLGAMDLLGAFLMFLLPVLQGKKDGCEEAAADDDDDDDEEDADFYYDDDDESV